METRIRLPRSFLGSSGLKRPETRSASLVASLLDNIRTETLSYQIVRFGSNCCFEGCHSPRAFEIAAKCQMPVVTRSVVRHQKQRSDPKLCQNLALCRSRISTAQLSPAPYPNWLIPTTTSSMRISSESKTRAYRPTARRPAIGCFVKKAWLCASCVRTEAG